MLGFLSIVGAYNAPFKVWAFNGVQYAPYAKKEICSTILKLHFQPNKTRQMVVFVVQFVIIIG